jgi:hypothetical protein
MTKNITLIRRLLVSAVILAAAVIFAGPLARAQVPSVPPPYNVDLGALITNSARAPATVTSAQQDNLAYHGAECTFNQSAASGSSSTVFSIQFYDSASNTYQTLVTSGAITASATPTTIVVYPGIQTSSLPTGMVALNMDLPRKWRVSQTNSGANTTTTGTIGCNLLK